MWVYLSWMIVKPEYSSQRVDDLLIKKTHLFRWGIWRGLWACFSAGINHASVLHPPPWETPHTWHDGRMGDAVRNAQNRSFGNSDKDRIISQFGRLKALITVPCVMFCLLPLACKINITSVFLQIINELSSHVSAKTPVLFTADYWFLESSRNKKYKKMVLVVQDVCMDRYLWVYHFNILSQSEMYLNHWGRQLHHDLIVACIREP